MPEGYIRPQLTIDQAMATYAAVSAVRSAAPMNSEMAIELDQVLLMLRMALRLKGIVVERETVPPGSLPSISDQFVCRSQTGWCPACEGSGYVCEDHPDHPWDGGECCGAAGMPCDPAHRGETIPPVV